MPQTGYTVYSGNSELGFVTNFVYPWEVFTIQHVVYAIKNRPGSPKMFTNERLFTIQAFTITRVHCTYDGQWLILKFKVSKPWYLGERKDCEIRTFKIDAGIMKFIFYFGLDKILCPKI